ncbi:PTS transporter subunit IIC [Kineothrix sp. MB12-C1]|uniref:PTS transporter subunit IIC n=1 Tax=Kineothrix sp. MB12-C1 TaxID=3070215 RepID=UPI0027D34B2E|nr:PTS sugar transporter subunit IIC [Kineothrix sp. MB12-C1]WMC93102.1 PTS sugar transporter subunit IIC [Kineothrix sp. MB12-C1]
MEKLKKVLNEIFIEGMSGMASGLFATLIIGTIIQQIGNIIPGSIGEYLFLMGKVAAALTGAGIGCGAAVRLKSSPLVILSTAVAGMIGAFAAKIIEGSAFTDGVIHFAGPGEPLGAFIAATVAIYIGRLVAGKTKVDILVTPFACIISGGTVGLLIGPSISAFMMWLGSLVNWGTVQSPFLMGIIVSVLMGIILTLPISSAALGIILGLDGIAAGAAVVGCCANMVGFAVASFRENKTNGLLAQGLGTSMLQMGNIVKKPVIWLPAIITSAILGPISTMGFAMVNNPTGSGMGTAGLVGQINAYQAMIQTGMAPGVILYQVILMHFVLPAVLSFLISEFMRKKGWINDGDMKLNV